MRYFGGTRVGKRYVSYYLMPGYVFPDLLDGISPELRRRMQGKSCFNFTKVDDVLFAELADLTAKALPRYQAMEIPSRDKAHLPTADVRKPGAGF